MTEVVAEKPFTGQQRPAKGGSFLAGCPKTDCARSTLASEEFPEQQFSEQMRLSAVSLFGELIHATQVR
jgi:hypothetical protein